MINQIRIENFRSIKSATVFLPSFGAIVGKNASGKTNLVHAISFARALVTGRSTLEAQKKITILPHELLNISKDSTGDQNIYFSFDIESSGQKKYCLEFSMQLNDNGENSIADVSEFHIVMERLFRIISEKKKNKIYERSGSKLRDALDKDIPLKVESTKLVLALYNQPDVNQVRLSFARIRIPEPESISSRELLVLSGVPPVKTRGLAHLLLSLQRTDPEAFEKFKNIAKDLVPSITTLENTQIEGGDPEQPTYLFLFSEQNLTSKLSMFGMSDGDLRSLYLIAAILSLRPLSTIVIDEIENGLHPDRAIRLIKYLENIARIGQIQVLFTTHSPDVINKLSVEEIIFVGKDKNGDSQFKLLIDSEQLSIIKKMLKEGTQMSDFLDSFN
ncbi:MAG: hypothetical protein A3A97_01225 [Candidatus Terrybacteria bacterium RIFCSPLOWO2_01_FULL_40_23]|uniref:ATPase AAA-type core domain-containing protein n=1 Tax=Candidatus Terrybacteria bacterium RIFCSPLOWO2_01_FULL_40_23 TaxID=1802366 RepID=A0A1G2PWP9_9BACT|nr:MAG: hypothetical protein A3A97_01225 [Candidatus Terrybacteria bacterium RIFCSPLOWO2_01_FULL_40_23]